MKCLTLFDTKAKALIKCKLLIHVLRHTTHSGCHFGTFTTRLLLAFIAEKLWHVHIQPQ